MLDKTHIILKAAASFDAAQLDQYGKVINTLPQIGVLYLKLYRFIDSGSALHAIQQMSGVVYAEYNQTFSVDKDSPWLYTPTTGAAVHNRAIYEVIRANEAWEITKGHPDVVICHLDTGVQQSHPNLRVVYGGTSQEGVLNLSPANNINRVDVDDMAGEAVGLRPGNVTTLRVLEYDHAADVSGTGRTLAYKQIYSDAACTQPLANPYDMTGVSGLVIYMDGLADIFIDVDDGSENYSTWSFGGIGDTSCFDGVGHGTATCSLINGQHEAPDGVCGIAPGCTLVHFRMSDALGGGNNMDSVNLMLAAADYPGCKIITNSWGVTDAASPTSLALHDAINYALGKDIIVGFASGNAGTHADTNAPDYYIYPASWDGVLSVSGTGNPKTGTSITHFTAESDDYDYFTVNEKVTRNDKVFISAPMAQISVAVPDTPNLYWDSFNVHGPPSKARRYTVLEFGGTSCAMPIVAGVIGLMYSAARENGLTRTSSQIKTLLAGSATTGIKLLNGTPAGYVGAGIVNAYAAVQSAISGSVVTAPAVQTTPKLQLTQNVTDATRQIVFKVTGVTPQTLTVAIDGNTTNTINSGLIAGSNTVTLPSLTVGLHDMTATLTYSGGSVTVSEPVAINPTAGVVYALPLAADGRKLRWSICGKAPSGYTIKGYKVSFGGITVDTTVNGSTFFAVSAASGIRTGTLDLAHYPAGAQSYAAEITAYSGSTPYVFTAAADSYNNTLGYISTPPAIANFAAPATVSGLVIPVEFTATDDTAVTGYLITETSTAPALDNTEWTTTAPTDYTVSGYGSYMLYGWAKDAEGNLSGPYSVSVTTTDATAGAFALPAVTLQPVVAAPTLSGIQRGSFTAPVVTLRPTVAAPTLTGVQRGSFTLPAVTLTPTVTAPTLNGVSVAAGAGAFTLPAVTLRPIVSAPRLFGMTGGASIRAPSGQPLNLRRIDGTPFTILSI